jgi:hypothetical protein
MGIATDFFFNAASVALIVVVWVLCVECRSVHASIHAYDNDHFAQTGTTAAEQMLSRALAPASHLRTEDNVKSKQGEESDELISWQSDCEVNVQPHPEASPGRPGSMCLPGPSGPTGLAGANGMNGKTGPAGLPGRAGMQGPPGSQDAAGSAGTPGPVFSAGKAVNDAAGDSVPANSIPPLPQVCLPSSPLAEKSVNPVVESNQRPKTDALSPVQSDSGFKSAEVVNA